MFNRLFSYRVIGMLLSGLSLLIATVSYAQSDPTKPLWATSVATNKKVKGKFVLQSIIKSGTQNSAVINGKLLQQGDKFYSYQVKTIANNKVVLVNDDKRLELALFNAKNIKSIKK